LQDDPAQLTHDVHLLMIFMGILAISVLAVVVVVMIAGIVIAGLAGRAIKSAEALEKRASPILEKANELMIEFVPQLRTLSDNAEHISTVVRGKLDEVSGTVTKVNETVQQVNDTVRQVNETVQQVNETVRDANGRARSQVARADTIVTDAMTATQDMSHKVQHAITVPVRQVAGLVAGIKVGLETLIERSPFANIRGGKPSEPGQYGGVRPDGTVPHGSIPREPGRPYDV
jgi:methyl-accepting chemotaxis protein